MNPVSGVGKVSQIIFAIVAPGKIVSNLIAGAIAEAGKKEFSEIYFIIFVLYENIVN